MLIGKMDYKGQRPVIQDFGPRIDISDTTDLVTIGEYMARTSCTECHGINFEGQQLSKAFAPNLRMVAAYSIDQFIDLMKNGVPIGGVKNNMSEVSLARFTYLKDQEIKALHAYLSTLSQVENQY
jgi:mono/diheme cytochrome c family protein